MIRLLTSTLFMCLCLTAQAQRDRFTVTPNLGVAAHLTDAGLGIHLGVNPSYRILPWLSAEAQLSFMGMELFDFSLSGQPVNKANLVTAQVMGGLRIYLANDKRKVRPFINGLWGVGYVDEDGIVPGPEAAGSLGFYLQWKKMVGGLAVESPGIMILKFGYAFPLRVKSGS